MSCSTRAVLVLVLVTGCGRIGFEDQPTFDAGPGIDGGPGHDAGASDGGRSIDSGPVDSGTPIDSGSSFPPDWWNTSWGHRIRLQFLNGTSSENLAEMPVLVTLTSAHLGGLATASPSGDDLRFVDADGTTVLAYEIDTWNASGTSTVWVRVPQVDASNSDFIWLYFGNAAAPAGANGTAVWSAAFSAVWHLGDFHDSTSNANNASATNVTAQPGQIGGGQVFVRATPSYAEVPDAASFHLSTNVSMSGWARKTNAVVDDWSAILSRQTAATVDDELWLGFFQGNYASTFATSATRDQLRGSAAPIDTWVYLVSTYDGTTARLYVNGFEQPGTSMALSGAMIDSPNRIILGGDQNPGTIPNADFFDGTIDEMRIESVARSPSWIAAQYTSMTDAFIQYGPLEP